MAAVVVDPARTRTFATAEDFRAWLAENHDRETELWIKLHKKGSGLPSITWNEAVDVCLCFGWIDGIRKSFDERSFVQRYTPRGKKSIWSQINVDNVTRLIAEGRMTPHGLAHVEAAKADGRWARAYAPVRARSLPDDLLRAIDASPRARATFETLDGANRFALGFRVNNLKTEAGRKAKIEAFVDMLARGETLIPMKSSARRDAAAKPAASPKAKATASGARAKTIPAAKAKGATGPRAKRAPAAKTAKR